MSGNRCRAREDQAEEYLRQHGDSSLSTIAAALKVKPNTASHYLQCLKRDGRVVNTGLGCQAVWRLGETPQPPVAKALLQVASVWDYAERMK